MKMANVVSLSVSTSLFVASPSAGGSTFIPPLTPPQVIARYEVVKVK
jgi:hypothetical protein